MKLSIIYLAHSREFDFQRLFYQPLTQALEEHNIIVPHQNGAEASFDSREVIPSCDFMIAEVSYPSTGLGMELAWADSSKVPTLCLHRENKKPSGSVYHLCNEIKSYKDETELQAIVKKMYLKMLKPG